MFEDARGLDDATMQALALQFNLSETTFVLPSTVATAHVRIFTPTFEMAFAGHPTLGTAHVVRSLAGTGDAVTLEMRAGVIPVSAEGDSLDAFGECAEAPRGRGDAVRELAATLRPDVSRRRSRSRAAAVVGRHRFRAARDSARDSADAVRRAAPRPDLMQSTAATAARAMAYVFAPEPRKRPTDGNVQRVVARFFFPKHGAIVEDPGTGSACANLGGWLLATGARLAAADRDRAGRPGGPTLPTRLEVDRATAGSWCPGRVIELGRGSVTL